jgi:hypothetical protein
MWVRTLGRPINLTLHDTQIELHQFCEGTAGSKVAGAEISYILPHPQI